MTNKEYNFDCMKSGSGTLTCTQCGECIREELNEVREQLRITENMDLALVYGYDPEYFTLRGHKIQVICNWLEYDVDDYEDLSLVEKTSELFGIIIDRSSPRKVERLATKEVVKLVENLNISPFECYKEIHCDFCYCLASNECRAKKEDIVKCIKVRTFMESD